MGAVHGVHMKYIGLGAALLLALPYTAVSPSAPPPPWLPPPLSPYFHPLAFLTLYSGLLNLLIGVLFKLRRGCSLLMKDPLTGSIPPLSYLLWFPFHAPTWLYTYLHTALGETHGVNVADEVLEGFWVGGRYAGRIAAAQRPPETWQVTVDLTSEFPEACIENTVNYVNSPVWDGTPPSVSEVERCALAISEGWSGSLARRKGG
eukprot:CAMPEP_0182456912 /NCGR_PEP_ID=MMETSP1319-20130603/2609_1 /TAXON_ID=172717 /ORGANISM="Bolidomonas pacifica, Strain RCC208" /LENGTH=203 /DNA_ID=CAMNT_0024655261 /DNA_START=105 /DNA_END=712 /DNA_ORIENTATION=+